MTNSKWAPSEIDMHITAFLLSVAEVRNMLISAGSDYHGENKTDISLGQNGIRGSELHPQLISFLETCKKGGM